MFKIYALVQGSNESVLLNIVIVIGDDIRIFKKSRSVAYTLQPALEAELNRMQQEGILEPVESSEWATSLVIAILMGI